MPNDALLTSLSAYPAVVALIPAVLPVLFTDRGWNIATSVGREGRTALRPSEGKCEKLFFDDLGDGPLHVCRSLQCHAQPHVPSATCWNRTLTAVLNHWIGSGLRLVEKPKVLPVSQAFLRVDADIIRSFIFMTQDAVDPASSGSLSTALPIS